MGNICNALSHMPAPLRPWVRATLCDGAHSLKAAEAPARIAFRGGTAAPIPPVSACRDQLDTKRVLNVQKVVVDCDHRRTGKQQPDAVQIEIHQ